MGIGHVLRLLLLSPLIPLPCGPGLLVTATSGGQLKSRGSNVPSSSQAAPSHGHLGLPLPASSSPIHPATTWSRPVTLTCLSPRPQIPDGFQTLLPDALLDAHCRPALPCCRVSVSLSDDRARDPWGLHPSHLRPPPQPAQMPLGPAWTPTLPLHRVVPLPGTPTSHPFSKDWLIFHSTWAEPSQHAE